MNTKQPDKQPDYSLESDIGEVPSIEIRRLNDLFNDLNFELEDFKISAISHSRTRSIDNDSDDGINAEAQLLHDCHSDHTALSTNSSTNLYTYPNTSTTSIANNNDIPMSLNIISTSPPSSLMQLSEDHIFSPMSLKDIMKLETPKSRVDDYLKEIQKVLNRDTRQSYLQSYHVSDRNESTPFHNIFDNECDAFMQSIHSHLYEDYLCNEEKYITDTTKQQLYNNDNSITDTTKQQLYNNNNRMGNVEQNLYNTDYDMMHINSNSDENVIENNTLDVSNFSDSATIAIGEEDAVQSIIKNDLNISTNTTTIVADNVVKKEAEETAQVPQNHSKKISSKYSRENSDLLIQGDFSIWSTSIHTQTITPTASGGTGISEYKKLFGEEIEKEYIGLHRTALTHNNDHGVLVPAFPLNTPHHNVSNNNLQLTLSKQLQVGMTEPFVPCDALTEDSIQTTRVNDNDDININQALQSAGINMRGHFFAVHLLECVVRPDIEGETLLQSVASVARICDYKHAIIRNNQIIIAPTYNNQVNHSLVSQQLTSTLSNSDVIFKTKQSFSTNSSNRGSFSSSSSSWSELIEFDIIDIQLAVSRNLRHRVLVCLFLRRIPRINTTGLSGLIIHHLTGGTIPLPLANSPKTKLFISKLKRELAASKICLSALYKAPIRTVCSLSYPHGLDPLFRFQLYKLQCLLMWQQLQEDINGMTGYLQEKMKECQEFVDMFLPVMKHYNLPPPSPCVIEPLIVDEPAAITVSSDFTTTPALLLSPNRKKSTTIESSHTSPKQPRNIVRYSSTPDTTAAAFKPQGNDNNNNNDYQSELNKVSEVDGMTFCLVMLDECYRELQYKCDVDYTNRIEIQNKYVIAQLAYIHEYKQAVLKSISTYKDAMASNFMKAFMNTFRDQLDPGPVAAPTIKINQTVHTENIAGSTEVVAPSKRWIDGMMSNIFTSTTPRSNVSSPPTLGTNRIIIEDVSLSDSKSFFIPKEKRRKQSLAEVKQRLHYNAMLSETTIAASESTIIDNDELDISKQPTNCESSMIAVDTIEIFNTTNDIPKQLYNHNTTLTINPSTNPRTTMVVLYYCACLVGTMPGTIYITSQDVYISNTSLLSLKPKNIVYKLKHLSKTILPNSNNSSNIVSENQRQKQQSTPSSSQINNSIASDTKPTTTSSSSIVSSFSSLLNSNSLTLVFTFDNNSNTDEVDTQVSSSSTVTISPFVINCKKLETILFEIKQTFADSII